MKDLVAAVWLRRLLISLVAFTAFRCSNEVILYPDDIEAIVASISTLSETLTTDEAQEAVLLDSLVFLSTQLQHSLARDQDPATLTGLLSRTDAHLTRLNKQLVVEDAVHAGRLGALRAEVERLEEKISSTERTQFIANENAWEFFKTLLWPALALIIILGLFLSQRARQRVQELFRPFKSVSAFGLTLLLDEETKRRADEVVANYRKETQHEFDKWVGLACLNEKLNRLVTEDIKPRFSGKGNVPDFRATIHVKDLLFDDTVYQLLDYNPKGGGRGRANTTRFGITGKTWRLEESKAESIPSDNLVQEWGMTTAEAQIKGRDKQSFLAVLLQDKFREKVGICYLDSEAANAFDDAWIKFIEDKCKEKGITRELTRMTAELYKNAPRIKVHDR